MLHELFLTHCTKGTSIMNPFTFTTRFDENSDLSTTYLGTSDKTRNDKLKVEESFPISEHGHMLGKLLDGTECQLLLDTGASKLFMSKSFLHAMQVTSLFAQICIKHPENTGRKWSLCQCLIYHTSYCRHTWTQI